MKSKNKIFNRQKGCITMKDMMKAMVREMMTEMMKDVMKEMMTEMMGTPQVAPAEATTPAPMSKTEFLSLEAEEYEVAKKRHNDNLAPLDFIVVDFKPRNAKKSRKALKYNKYIANKAVWTYNHIMIRQNYPNIKFSDGHYYADSLADLQSLASSYHIVEHLTEEQFAVVKAYWDGKKKN